jgi:hypothetical protein
VAVAQVGGPYSLVWSTIDGGGTTAVAGGSYVLGGTAGQPEAGSMAGGVYALSGGFWFAGAVVTAIDDEPAPPAAPAQLRILPSAPNPFGAATAFALELPAALPVAARIYNAAGQLVRTLCDGPRPAGRHEIVWDARDEAGARVARGVYLLTTRVGVSTRTQKLILVD